MLSYKLVLSLLSYKVRKAVIPLHSILLASHPILNFKLGGKNNKCHLKRAFLFMYFHTNVTSYKNCCNFGYFVRLKATVLVCHTHIILNLAGFLCC